MCFFVGCAVIKNAFEHVLIMLEATVETSIFLLLSMSESLVTLVTLMDTQTISPNRSLVTSGRYPCSHRKPAGHASMETCRMNSHRLLISLRLRSCQSRVPRQLSSTRVDSHELRTAISNCIDERGPNVDGADGPDDVISLLVRFGPWGLRKSRVVFAVFLLFTLLQNH